MRLLQKKSKKNEACVIRTRNLQDWNLTRYRCANAPSMEPPTPTRSLEVDGID